jgi:restriction system protein
MHNHEVIPAFEMLLDEMETVVEGMNQEGALLLTAGKYDAARVLIEKVEAINAVRDKLQSLSEEWHQLSVKPVKKTGKRARQRTPKSAPRLKKGLRTPEDAFKLPLLKTLIEMGGAGRVSDVIDHMEKHVKSILTEHDHELLKSSNEPRWRNTVAWARSSMVKAGLLDQDSPYGVWTITEQGRVWAEEQSKEPLRHTISEKQIQMPVPKEKNGHTDQSVALEQIIEVCHELYHNGRDYHEAIQEVADRRGLKSIHTVADKCTRQLGLSTAEFKALAEDKFKLMKLLLDEFPKDQYYIIEQLGS